MLFLLIIIAIININIIIIVVKYERLSIFPSKVPLRSQKDAKPKGKEKVLENEQLKQMTNNDLAQQKTLKTSWQKRETNIRISISYLTGGWGNVNTK